MNQVMLLIGWIEFITFLSHRIKTKNNNNNNKKSLMDTPLCALSSYIFLMSCGKLHWICKNKSILLFSSYYYFKTRYWRRFVIMWCLSQELFIFSTIRWNNSSRIINFHPTGHYSLYSLEIGQPSIKRNKTWPKVHHHYSFYTLKKK